MKKSRRTYNGVHLNKKSNTQDVVEQSLTKNGNAPIIARITIDQVVAQFNTKLEINPAHWSVKLGKASGRTAEAVHINSMLESIHSTVPQQD